MKVRIKHQFFLYASQFTLVSMLEAVSYWSNYAYNHPDQQFGSFMIKKQFSVQIENTPINGKTDLIQTWLIDMIYELVKNCNYGKRSITKEESLFLICLFNDYRGNKDKEYLENPSDIKLFLYAFYGEQARFQNIFGFRKDYSREKYILEEMPQKLMNKNNKVRVKKEFFLETGFNMDDFASLLFAILAYFTSHPIVTTKEINTDSLNNPVISSDNIWKIINRYSTDVDQIRNSSLKRQLLYKFPIIQLNEKYISSSPFLLLSLFSNAIYWIMRDKYQKNNSQSFINEFGYCFEAYIEDVLSRCLNESDFIKLAPDDKNKRADWYIRLGKYDLIVEQKSSLSMLSIKQSYPDLDAMKRYIKQNWGEAVEQLDHTQKELSLKAPIKIILTYDSYLKAECLEELFRLNPILNNDGKYWLLSVGEFEDLLCLYKNKPRLAQEIIKEKDDAETSFSNNGRELEMLMSNHNVRSGLYLKEFGILKQFDILIENIRKVQ